MTSRGFLRNESGPKERRVPGSDQVLKDEGHLRRDRTSGVSRRESIPRD